MPRKESWPGREGREGTSTPTLCRKLPSVTCAQRTERSQNAVPHTSPCTRTTSSMHTPQLMCPMQQLSARTHICCGSRAVHCIEASDTPNHNI